MSLPALRFKEFCDSWNETKIGEITSKLGSGSTPRGGMEVYQLSGIQFIRSQNVNNEQLLLDDVTYISEEINTQMKGSVVKPNDILLNITGASIGRSCVVPSNFLIGNVNQHVCIIRLKADYIPRFLQPYLSSSRGQKSISSTQVGSGREGLNFEAIRSFKVSVPSPHEQTKIANFLTAVDEKITQLTQKHDLLTQYKKGVMQQIFCQELRFRDDDGQDFPEWEDKLLGQLCSITTGKLDANAMVADGQYRFYTCAREYYQIDKYAFDTEALLISGNGANVGYIHYYKGKFNAYQRTYVLDNFEQNIIFVKYFLDEFLHVRIFKEAKEGNTPYIVMGTLTDMEIKIPPLPEQTKIANFLTAIDEKITATQTQLQAVKQYKQGLLQQMFV